MKELFSRLRTNKLVNQFIVLLTGEGIVSLLNIVSLGVILEAIGLEKNGIILSLQTYCLLFNNIFGFKSFQALIKYLSIALVENNKMKIMNYIYQSYLLDIIAVLVATVASIIFLKPYATFMGWDIEIIRYTSFFIIAYLFQVQGTAVGILRFFDKFNYITYCNIIINIIRFILYIIGLIINCSFIYFVVIEAILIIFPNILLNYYAYITLKQKDLNHFYKIKLDIDYSFVKFNLYSNIGSTIDIPVGTLTTIFINKYLGYELISVYKIFEKLGGLINKLGSPLSQIIYPEMNIYISKKEFIKAKNLNKYLFYGLSAIGIFILIGTMLTYKYWLGMFINNYETYIGSLLLYFILIIFTNSTVGVHSLFIALNYIKHNIYILLLINIIYLPALILLIQLYSLNGVIIALLLQAIAVVIIKQIILIKKGYTEYR